MLNSLRKCSLPLILVAAMSSGAMAQDEEEGRPDARTEGYKLDTGVGRVAIEKGGSGAAATWFVLAGLGLLGVGVMFKSGKRTHLD